MGSHCISCRSDRRAATSRLNQRADRHAASSARTPISTEMCQLRAVEMWPSTASLTYEPIEMPVPKREDIADLLSRAAQPVDEKRKA